MFYKHLMFIKKNINNLMVIIKKKDGMAYKYMKGEIKTQTCILTLIYINLGKHGYVRRKIEFTVAYGAPAQHI